MPQWEFLDFLVGEAKTLPGVLAADAGRRDRAVTDGDGRVAGVRGNSPEGDVRDPRRLHHRLRRPALDGPRGRRPGGRGPRRADRRALVSRLPRPGRRGLGPGPDRARATSSSPSTAATTGSAPSSFPRAAPKRCSAQPSRCSARRSSRPRRCSRRTSGRRAVERRQAADRRRRPALDWSKPGLLCIGDAAHAMSPIGGVGINLAIQDAVAAANLLAAKLRAGAVDEATSTGAAPPPLADRRPRRCRSRCRTTCWCR